MTLLDALQGWRSWWRGTPVAKTPTIIQVDALDCGPAALGIILAHFGRWVPIEELRVACGVSRDGSKAINILKAARSYGLEARGATIEPSLLRRLEPPVILHWRFSHFVVFDGFLRGGKVRINDPAGGPQKISEAELDENMTGVVLALEPGADFRRGGAPPRLLASLVERLKGTHWALLFLALTSFLLLIPGLATPALTRLFVDQVLLAGQSSWLATVLVGLVFVTVLVGGLTWLQRSYLLRLETRIAAVDSCRFVWRLLCLPLEFFHQRFLGDLSARVGLNDRVAQLLSRDFSVNLLGISLIGFFGLVLFQLDPVLALVSGVAVSLNAFTLRAVARWRTDNNRRLLREQGKLTGMSLWGLDMIESLKAVGCESALFARWAGQQAKVVNIRQSLERSALPLAIVPPLVAALNGVLVLGLGGLRVVEGEMSLGTLVAFQVLVLAFIGPVQRLVLLGGNLQLTLGQIALLDDVRRAEPAFVLPAGSSPTEQENPKPLEGRLELRNVAFGYSPLDAPLIEDLELKLEPGQWTALVGPTGSGKSTVAKLVAGLYTPWRGEILFDGEPRQEVTRERWIRSVGVVDQDTFVFEGTVRENLTLWSDKISSDTLWRAARDAVIDEELRGRPGGLDSRVAEGGRNWSGGQLQRLEIARALCGDPTLLVLDEATSALDPETEAEIIRRLRDRGCSCLVIAHRLSTIRHADEILVLDRGRAIQRGRHDQLMGQPGPYSSLVFDE